MTDTSINSDVIGTAELHPEEWLSRWLPLLSSSPQPVSALDIGCGYGTDSRFLKNLGIKVTSVDICWECLETCRNIAKDSLLAQVDIGKGIPFARGCFQLIISNLSLHFFTEKKSKEVLEEVGACLDKQGWLFARLNSSRDIHPRTMEEPELEPNLIQSRRLQKRFYNQKMVEDLFYPGWEIVSMEEIISEFHQKPKILWEVIVQKTAP